MIGNFFNFMDLFGYGFYFKMNKQDRIYSWKVGVLSSIFITGSLIYIISTCIKWYNNIYTTKSLKQVQVSLPYVRLSTNYDFMFLYCLGTQNNSTERIPIVKDSMNFTFKWRNVYKFPYEINGEVPIEMKKCSLDQINNNVSNRFSKRHYDGCLCATVDTFFEDVSYFFTDSYYTFYDLQVKFNDSILNNKTLYNNMVDYFNNKTPVGYFYYVDTSADIDAYTKPFISFINFHSQVLNPTSQVISNIYMTNINMHIDDNLIYDGITKYNGVSVDRELTNTKTGITYDSLRNYDSLHSVRLFASNKIILLERTNMKYDVFIGNIFSFLMPFYLILKVISNRIDSLEVKQTLIHQLYKNYRIKNKIMNKIKYIRDTFNEVEEINEKKQNNSREKYTKENNNTLDIIEEVDNKNKRRIRSKYKQTSSSIIMKDAKGPERTISIKIQKSDNVFNNDPLDLECNRRTEEKLNLGEVFNRIDEIDFKYDWFRYYFMKCTKNKQKYLIREKYFECAESLIDYYLDISIYFKKMIEVDVIKSLHFNSEQKLLLNYCCITDFSFKNQEKMSQTIDDLYNRTAIIDVKSENQLIEIIKKSRQDEMTDKIIDLIEINKIYD